MTRSGPSNVPCGTPMCNREEEVNHTCSTTAGVLIVCDLLKGEGVASVARPVGALLEDTPSGVTVASLTALP